MRRLAIGASFALTAAVSVVGSSTQVLQVTGVANPAAGISAQPHLSTSARGVLLSWIERTGQTAALKFAERTAVGWTQPRTVASGDNWFVNWADVPSVLRLPNGVIVGHWLQKSGGGPEAYDVRLAYSKDNGQTFSDSILPHHDGTQTEHGFASLFPQNGGLGLVWLDGRATSGGHDAAQHQSSGAMTLRFASFDAQWKQTADMPVDLRVCDCCPTTAAMTSDGPIVAFRDRSEGEIRDIHVSRFESGAWTPSRPVASDNWNITGCPVNGPMLSARGRDVVLTWFTGAGGQPRVLAAFSRDAGRTFGAAVRIDDAGTLGRVDAELLADGSAIVSWVEHVNRTAEFRIRRVSPDGTKSAPVTVAPVSIERSSGFPRIAVSGSEIVLAWVDVEPGQNRGAAQTRIRTAVSKIPQAQR
ncbi:MAG TPA: sialidase family protein [Vicinamibacterales bacterium]|nr:sialidase family protein [Vicinamibacterales bacterium]